MKCIVALLHIVFWGTVLVGGLAVAEQVDQPHCTPSDTSFEHLILMLQWPPNYKTNKGASIGHWTIHGLWPSRIQAADTYPCDCSDEKFDIEMIRSIESSLKIFWPSLENNPDASFWAHEWEYHGTCGYPTITSQLNYFRTTLDLRHRYDPEILLTNLPPSLNGYSYNEVYAALSKNGDVILNCRRQGNQQLLEEVGFCIGRGQLQVQFDCPSSVKSATSDCDPNIPIVIKPTVPSPTPHSGCTPNDPSYQYYTLVLQWPPNYGSNKGESINFWTISGLWPSRTVNTNTYPCDCTNEKFSMDKIRPLESSLEMYWPTLNDNAQDAEFWAARWEKHGTCAGPLVTTQLQYFETTLDLLFRYDPDALLLEHPPSQNGYSYSSIHGALSKHGTPILRCERKGNVQLLKEVRFCISMNHILEQINCPDAAVTDQSNCKPDVPIVLNPPTPKPGPTEKCTPSDESFDYYTLVLQWPPNFGTSKGASLGHWTIHGLWPSRLTNAKTYPCDCTTEAFDGGQIQSIESNLKAYWPTLKDNSPDAKFWKWEWEKHGTCAMPSIKTQLEYFKTTLDLRHRYDPEPLLSQLPPSPNGYSYDALVSALGKNGTPILWCQKIRGNRQVLKEIGFCINASKLLVQFSCPFTVSTPATNRCDPNLPIILNPVQATS